MTELLKFEEIYSSEFPDRCNQLNSYFYDFEDMGELYVEIEKASWWARFYFMIKFLNSNNYLTHQFN